MNSVRDGQQTRKAAALLLVTALLATAVPPAAAGPDDLTWSSLVATLDERRVEALGAAEALYRSIPAMSSHPAATFADELWQLAMLQNPVLDPGFTLLARGVPIWQQGADPDSVDAQGRLVLAGDIQQTVGQVVGQEVGVPVVVSPFTGFEVLMLNVSAGDVTVRLEFAEKSTGAAIALTWSALGPGDHALRNDTAVVESDFPGSEPILDVLAQSFWVGITITAPTTAILDDVVIDGVAFGDPLVSLELDDPAPQGLPDEVPFPDLSPSRPMHDGFGVLVELVQHPHEAIGDAPSFNATIAFVRYTPSGAVPYDFSGDIGVDLYATDLAGGAPVLLGSWEPADGTKGVTHGGASFEAAEIGPFEPLVEADSMASFLLQAVLERAPGAITDAEDLNGGLVVGAYNALKLQAPDVPVVDALDMMGQPVVVQTLRAVVVEDGDADGIEDFVEKRVCDRRGVRAAVNDTDPLGTCVTWSDWNWTLPDA